MANLENTQIALLGIVFWSLLLLMSLGTLRTIVGLTQNKPANSFAPSGDDMSAFGKRLTRAHANCYEFVPFVGLVLLYAIATGQTAVTNGLVLILLGARVLQSIVHIVSTSVPAVLIRFLFFIVQAGVTAFWILKLAGIL